MVLGFSQNQFVFQETDGYARVEFYRHGDLSHDTTVYCNITLQTLDSSDVLILPVPEVVIIPANGTVGGEGVGLQVGWVWFRADIIALT